MLQLAFLLKFHLKKTINKLNSTTNKKTNYIKILKEIDDLYFNDDDEDDEDDDEDDEDDEDEEDEEE